MVKKKKFFTRNILFSINAVDHKIFNKGKCLRIKAAKLID